jgi:hypothetical protein
VSISTHVGRSLRSSRRAVLCRRYARHRGDIHHRNITDRRRVMPRTVRQAQNEDFIV